jgi:hypothetical protein
MANGVHTSGEAPHELSDRTLARQRSAVFLKAVQDEAPLDTRPLRVPSLRRRGTDNRRRRLRGGASGGRRLCAPRVAPRADAPTEPTAAASDAFQEQRGRISTKALKEDEGTAEGLFRRLLQRSLKPGGRRPHEPVRLAQGPPPSPPPRTPPRSPAAASPTSASPRPAPRDSPKPQSPSQARHTQARTRRAARRRASQAAVRREWVWRG